MQPELETFKYGINYELMSINYRLIIKTMEFFTQTAQRILTIVLRNVAGAPTLAMLAESLSLSHVGVWKAVKKLEAEQFIILKKAGTKENSTYTIHLNWSNPLVEKTLALALEHEATKQKRWVHDFAEVGKEVDFLMLYGSILHSPKEANDIDVLAVVSKKDGFIRVDKIISKIQISQLRKIHLIDFSSKELRGELKRPNKAFLDAFKKGVILFGQDKFVKFIKEMQQ